MIGKLSGKLVQVVPVLTNFAAQYSANDQVGAANKLTNILPDTKGCVLVSSIVLVDYAKQKKSTDVFFFNDNPTLAGSDNAAFDLTDANMSLYCIGAINIPAAAYLDSASNSVATVNNINLMLQGVAKSKDLYCVLVARDTPTYGSLSDLALTVGVVQS